MNRGTQDALWLYHHLMTPGAAVLSPGARHGSTHGPGENRYLPLVMAERVTMAP